MATEQPAANTITSQVGATHDWQQPAASFRVLESHSYQPCTHQQRGPSALHQQNLACGRLSIIWTKHWLMCSQVWKRAPGTCFEGPYPAAGPCPDAPGCCCRSRHMATLGWLQNLTSLPAPSTTLQRTCMVPLCRLVAVLQDHLLAAGQAAGRGLCGAGLFRQWWGTAGVWGPLLHCV